MSKFLPAYPTPVNGTVYHGLTIRDFFAAQIAGGDASAEGGWGENVPEGALMDRARFYYALADAMLQVRTEKDDAEK